MATLPVPITHPLARNAAENRLQVYSLAHEEQYLVMIINVTNSVDRDYRPIPHLDTYEGANLDDDDYESLSPGARADVERQLRKRDRQEGLASGRMRSELLYGDGSDEDEDEAPSHSRRRRTGGVGPGEGMEFDEVREGGKGEGESKNGRRGKLLYP